MNSAIYKNNVTAKKQKETFTNKVGQLNERLANRGIFFARMESGFKQMETKNRLIEIIRSNNEGFELIIGILENS